MSTESQDDRKGYPHNYEEPPEEERAETAAVYAPPEFMRKHRSEESDQERSAMRIVYAPPERMEKRPSGESDQESTERRAVKSLRESMEKLLSEYQARIAEKRRSLSAQKKAASMTMLYAPPEARRDSHSKKEGEDEDW